MADRNDKPTGWFAACVSAFSLSAFLTLILPFQTFLANSSNYEFPFARLAREQSVACVALTLALLALFRLSDRYLRGWLQALLIAALVALYLESGILSAGLPEIDGNLSPLFDGLPRKLWDAAVHSAGYLLLQTRFVEQEDLVKAFVKEAEKDFVGEIALDEVKDRELAFASLEQMAAADGDFSDVERACVRALEERVKQARNQAIAERYPRAVAFDR